MSALDTPLTLGESIKEQREDIVQALKASGIPRLNPLSRWKGSTDPGTVLVQFEQARQIQWGWRATFEIRVLLHTNPADAQEWIDNNVDALLDVATQYLEEIVVTPVTATQTGLSKATGAEFTVLSVLGVCTLSTRT